MPRGLLYVAIVAVVASLLPLAFIARSRSVPADRTRIQLVQDMGNQPKFKAQSENPLFADTRAMRPAIPDTQAANAPGPDETYETGRTEATWATALPVKVTEALVRRGQERFNIFCAPCHGYAGYGDGLVARRADQLQEGTWVPPTNLNSEQVRQRPNGHLFNTITNGIRNMPSYGAQIPIDDRWAIVTYVRAIQRSQNARPEDLPADRRPPAGWHPAAAPASGPEPSAPPPAAPAAKP